MQGSPSPDGERVRTAELVAALSLATDLGTGLPLEHGLRAALLAVGLADRAGVGPATAQDAYYGTLLFHIGCTTDAEVAAELFAEGAMLEHLVPVLFGSRREMVAGLARSIAAKDATPAAGALRAALLAVGLSDRAGVDSATAQDAYYGTLLFHIGCTTDAQVAAELFADGALLEHLVPVLFGSRREMVAGLARSIAAKDATPAAGALRAAHDLPRALRAQRRHAAAICEVGQMLAERLALPASARTLFAHLTERWDGKGIPGRARAEGLPLSVRIVHVAQDAAFQHLVGGPERATHLLRERAGQALDPSLARLLADDAGALLEDPSGEPAWDRALEAEPGAPLVLEGEAVDRALSAIGDFADLVSPWLAGHSAGVAALADTAAGVQGLPPEDRTTVRRAAALHDVGRVALSAGVWEKPGTLSAGEWEHVRLHAYHGERVLARSGFLAPLAPVAGAHHERADGSGYHRGLPAAALGRPARLLAAADAFHAMCEPRPHRPPLPPERAAEVLLADAQAGRLDPDAVGAVLEASGLPAARPPRPAGLTAREAEVVGLVARGLQTKQVAGALGISAKTADRHLQNAYAKMGVSTRAAATLFAVQHGLLAWGELPMARR